VGRYFKNGPLTEHAAAHAALGELYLSEGNAANSGNAIMLRQPVVEHRKVRLDEIHDAQIVLQQLVEEAPRLSKERPLQQLVVFGIEPNIGRRRIDLPQIEPLAGETLGKGRGFGIIEQ